MPSTQIGGHVLCQPTRDLTTDMWFVKPQKTLRRQMCFANPRTIKQLPQTPNPNTINVLHSSISLFTAATPVPGYESHFAYFLYSENEEKCISIMDPGVNYMNLGSKFLNKKLDFCTIIIKHLRFVLYFQVNFYAFPFQLHRGRTFF